MSAEAFQTFVRGKLSLCDEFAEISRNKAKSGAKTGEFHLPEVFFSSPSEFRNALYARFGIQPCDIDPLDVMRKIVDEYFD